jgi:hypothetical protein
MTQNLAVVGVIPRTESVAKMYRVVDRARLRASFEAYSEVVGFYHTDEIVEALEGRLNENGVLRIRTRRGWTNTMGADGTRLLVGVEPASPASQSARLRAISGHDSQLERSNEDARVAPPTSPKPKPELEELVRQIFEMLDEPGDGRLGHASLSALANRTGAWSAGHSPMLPCCCSSVSFRGAVWLI